MIPDKLWFYYSTRRREEQVGILNVFNPDGTPGENDQFQYFHSGKVSYQMTPNNKFIAAAQYVRQGVQQWMANWKRNGWRTASKRPVKNRDLWERLDELSSTHRVEWHWVKGHSGHPENELVDREANKAIDAMQARA